MTIKRTVFAVCLNLNSEFSEAHQLLSIHSTHELARIEALKYDNCLSKICITKFIIDAPYYQETVEKFLDTNIDYGSLINDSTSFKKYIKEYVNQGLENNS